LAELQLRKAQQKLRNRTAADAFPNGMHSTLLEMDAVTQLQQKSRKQKHVTLAWEDFDVAERQNFDDEDVPLGVLFPEKDRNTHANIHKPIGLMEKREMEDNEPLSQRRARLRGEPLQTPEAAKYIPSLHNAGRSINDTRYQIDVAGLPSDELSEDEGESLAQRASRIREEKKQAAGMAFAQEVSSQLALDSGTRQATGAKASGPEETLGQRRKRLQGEQANGSRHVSGESAEQVGRPQLKPRHTMAGLLQAHPVNASGQAFGGPHEVAARQAMPVNPMTYGSNGYNVGQPMANGTFLSGLYMSPIYGNSAPYMNAVPGINPAMMYSSPFAVQQPVAMPGYQYPYAIGMQGYAPDPMGPPLDPKQRAQIDRWRQSVVE